MTLWVAWVRMGAQVGFNSLFAPEYPRMWSASVIATAMVSVAGSSRSQTFWALLAFRPSDMAERVRPARSSMASDWLARTRSGSNQTRTVMTRLAAKMTHGTMNRLLAEGGLMK